MIEARITKVPRAIPFLSISQRFVRMLTCSKGPIVVPVSPSHRASRGDCSGTTERRKRGSVRKRDRDAECWLMNLDRSLEHPEPNQRGCPEGVGTSGPHDFKSPTFASISRKVVTQPVLSTHAPHRASMTEGQVRVQITPIVINQVNYIAFSDLHSAK